MKILFVSTIVSTVNAFLVPHIKMLQDQGHIVEIATNTLIGNKDKIEDSGIKVHHIQFQRSPFSKDNFMALNKIKKLVIEGQYDMVHTHTPVASFLTRLACRNIPNLKILYTAHGFHFHKGAPLKNWIIYYPIEKWLSRHTDCLITINEEDYERAKKFFRAKKVEYIPGVGLDVNRFKNAIIDKDAKREEIGLPKDAVIVLSVGELNRNKNHEVIIKAIESLNYPNIHYVICGKGPLDKYLRELAEELKIKNQVHLLGSRKDIAEICKLSDIFAFPSLREGLGMAALEAMACGIPIITSNVHGIVDYSVDGETGYACNPADIKGFSVAIKNLFKDKKMGISFGEYNKEVVKKYDIERVVAELSRIYQDYI